jgi:hypothetical protein
MFMSKVKLAATFVLTVALLTGARVFSYRSLATEPPQDPKPAGEQAKSTKTKSERDDERLAAAALQQKLQPLMQKRLDAIKTQLRARMEELLAGKTTVDVLLSASVHVTKAQLEMTDKPADQFKILEAQFERVKMAAEILRVRFGASKANIDEASQAEYYRYDAEIALERFKAKHGGKAPEGELTKALFEGVDVKDFQEIGK